ncbi:hypothetical protein BGZ94_007226 [Podila epigama]|nr:hypothetical protein BGZ94_007226 [Podila epigama]
MSRSTLGHSSRSTPQRYSPVNVDSSDSEDDLSESTPFAKHNRVHLYQQPEEDDELFCESASFLQ